MGHQRSGFCEPLDVITVGNITSSYFIRLRMKRFTFTVPKANSMSAEVKGRTPDSKSWMSIISDYV